MNAARGNIATVETTLMAQIIVAAFAMREFGTDMTAPVGETDRFCARCETGAISIFGFTNRIGARAAGRYPCATSRRARSALDYNELMGNIPAIPSNRTCASGGGESGPRARAARCGAVLTLVFTAFLAGCYHAPPVANTQQLDRSGMNYDSVQQLRALNITPPEVAEVMKLRDAGFPDATCVQAVQVFHSHGQAFRAEDIIGLSQAGMSEQMIFALASLNRFGENAGELEAMHLAGLSDAVVLEVARHRAEGKPVLSG